MSRTPAQRLRHIEVALDHLLAAHHQVVRRLFCERFNTKKLQQARDDFEAERADFLEEVRELFTLEAGS